MGHMKCRNVLHVSIRHGIMMAYTNTIIIGVVALLEERSRQNIQLDVFYSSRAMV